MAPTAGVDSSLSHCPRIIIALTAEEKAARLAAPFERTPGAKVLQTMMDELMENIEHIHGIDGPVLARMVDDLRTIYPHMDDETKKLIFMPIEGWMRIMAELHEEGHEPTFTQVNAENIRRAYQTILKLLGLGLSDAGIIADRYKQEMTADAEVAPTLFTGFETEGAAVERTEGEGIRNALGEATKFLRILRAAGVRDVMVKKVGADFPGEMEATSSVYDDLINMIRRIEESLGYFRSFFMPKDEKEKYRKAMQDLGAIAESIKEYEMRDIKIDERFTTILGHKLRAADETLKKVLTHNGVPKEGIGAETIKAISEFSKAEREARNTLP